MDDYPERNPCPKSFKQLFHYGLLGVSINLTGYLFYLLITHLGGTPKSTMSILYGIGIVLSYFGNRNLTFAHQGDVFASGFRFLIAHTLGYFINLALLILFVDILGYDHRLIQAIAILVVAFFLFFVSKYYVFRESSLPGGT